MVVTFCGHSEVNQVEPMKIWLREVLTGLISEGAALYYLGGYGEFDRLAATVLRELKTRYSSIQIALALPYLNSNIDTAGYDYTVYPPLEAVPLRFAISKRNEWMVMASDVIVSYVTHGWGGAAKTLAYAQRKHKRIIYFQ